jgi:DNA-binding transcriptional ArsR family regulator
MSQSGPQNGPPVVPRDAYPMVRIASEAFLRAVDLLTRLQDDGLIPSLVFLAAWYNHMQDPAGKPMAVREFARRLNLPYETVRRHAMALVRAGQCKATREGFSVVPAVLSSAPKVAALRGIQLNAERMLADLTRARLAKYVAPSGAARTRGKLLPHERAIATAATRNILAGIRMVGDFWNGDLLHGLVYTAIWTANVKHVVNTARASDQAVLPDELRRPVSILAIAHSLRLPYETVRRHAVALEKAGICHRVGRQGLVVPASVHRKLSLGTVQVHAIVTSLLVDLRRAGLKV